MPEYPAATGPNLEHILLNALGTLAEENPAAYKLLKVQIEGGFFALRMTNRPLQDLADEILKTVTEIEDRVDAS